MFHDLFVRVERYRDVFIESDFNFSGKNISEWVGYENNNEKGFKQTLKAVVIGLKVNLYIFYMLFKIENNSSTLK